MTIKEYVLFADNFLNIEILHDDLCKQDFLAIKDKRLLKIIVLLNQVYDIAKEIEKNNYFVNLNTLEEIKIKNIHSQICEAISLEECEQIPEDDKCNECIIKNSIKLIENKHKFVNND